MGKLDGKVAVITGASTGLGLAGAKLFVEEGAHVFITGRRQEALDEAVKAIGRNVTAVQGDAADLADLDRLYETVRREKGTIDVLWASAGTGEQGKLGEITAEQFDRAFWLNARGTLFTVQKALPLLNDGGSIFMTGSNASLGGFPGWSVYAGSKAVQQAWARVWPNELRDRRLLTPGQVATAKQEELFAALTRWVTRHQRNKR
ncbi:SDR family oxidoreductase [Actinomadura sp. 7K507]|uniref:SDR family NAD(P)-dependent oxidoreductase n=1 Tax=Actinomadura sp. 7K507 TaxID=2530365 RepID=UPI0010536EE2|nr:SDR family oxidoreductase [Actinomadura sp. 7K507]TDC86308.1 SDR family oxidoreductase [Actinomadura sp. 7K507]